MTNSFPTRRSSGLVVRSIFSVGHSPSVHDHRGVQVLAVRPTDCNDTPVPVAIFRFATHGGTADPLVKGNGRLLAAANFLFADDAELVALGCVNAVQADARPMDFYGISVAHHGLAHPLTRPPPPPHPPPPP